MVVAPGISRRELVGGAVAVTVGTLAGCRRVRPDDVEPGIAMAAVRHLAEVVGPRPGTAPSYFRAATWVEGQLERLGWQVSRERFSVPGGLSWGEPVDAGDSVNVIAHRGDVRRGAPWLTIGAHLDTVPQSPGAEDNASGVGVLLAVARAVTGRATTGRSCATGCRVCGSAARRTPPTTRPPTWRRSWILSSSSGPHGWSSAGSAEDIQR